VREELGEVELDVDLVAGCPEAIETAIGDLFGDEYSSHRGPSLPATRRDWKWMNESFMSRGRNRGGRLSRNLPTRGHAGG
jgi:hypothetical protein